MPRGMEEREPAGRKKETAAPAPRRLECAAAALPGNPMAERRTGCPSDFPRSSHGGKMTKKSDGGMHKNRKKHMKIL